MPWKARRVYATSIDRAFGIDYRTLALVRFLLGCVTLYDACTRLRDSCAFFSDDGVMPRSNSVSDKYALFAFDVFSVSGHCATASGIIVLYAVSAIALALGWHPNVCCVFNWVRHAVVHREACEDHAIPTIGVRVSLLILGGGRAARSSPSAHSRWRAVHCVCVCVCVFASPIHPTHHC